MKTRYRKIKPIILLAFAFTFSWPVFAQENTSEPDDEPKFSVGAKIGGNTGLLRKHNNFALYDKSSSAWGYEVGVYGSMKVLDFLKVRVEALYFVHAAQLEDITIASSLKFTNMLAQFNTIQFPLMAELGLPTGGSVRPKLMLGGFYSYNLNVRSIYDQVISYSDGSTQTSRVSTDVSDSFKHNQYGFLVGVGATFNVNDKPLLVELRYTHTLNNVDIDGFQYTYLGGNANKYGGKLYPTTLGLNVSYPIFTF